MSKHKRFHGMKGKKAGRKAYAFFHAKHPYGSVVARSKMHLLKKITTRPGTAGQREETPN